MNEEERTKLLKILENRHMSPREVILYRMLSQDNNLDRISKSLQDNPDIRGVAYDLLEI